MSDKFKGQKVLLFDEKTNPRAEAKLNLIEMILSEMKYEHGSKTEELEWIPSTFVSANRTVGWVLYTWKACYHRIDEITLSKIKMIEGFPVFKTLEELETTKNAVKTSSTAKKFGI